jgi:hypothetical protein
VVPSASAPRGAAYERATAMNASASTTLQQASSGNGQCGLIPVGLTFIATEGRRT